MTTDDFAIILDSISSGNSLKKSCEELGFEYLVVARKFRTDLELQRQYDIARDYGAEARFDELEEMAARAVHTLTSSAEIQARKLQIDTQRWIISKMLPKRFGDKIDLNHGGQDGNPLVTRIERVLIDSGSILSLSSGTDAVDAEEIDPE